MEGDRGGEAPKISSRMDDVAGLGESEGGVEFEAIQSSGEWRDACCGLCCISTVKA